jgi:hypothetical protein
MLEGRGLLKRIGVIAHPRARDGLPSILFGALRMVGAIKSGLGLGSADGNQDPWHGMVNDAHPLDYVEGQH